MQCLQNLCRPKKMDLEMDCGENNKRTKNFRSIVGEIYQTVEHSWHSRRLGRERQTVSAMHAGERKRWPVSLINSMSTFTCTRTNNKFMIPGYWTRVSSVLTSDAELMKKVLAGVLEAPPYYLSSVVRCNDSLANKHPRNNNFLIVTF